MRLIGAVRSAAAGPWWNRALVLAGKAGTGLLPVVMLAICARLAGARGVGQFAIALSLALAVADLADFTSHRHVPRVRLASGARDVVSRLAAFNSLRAMTLGLAFAAVGAGMFAALPRHDLPVLLAVFASAFWFFANNTSYATALADDDFLTLGVGPWVGLVMGGGAAAALTLASPSGGLWAAAAGLHAGKACETLALWWRLGVPRASLRADDLRREWDATRHLMLAGVVSAANARILVPMVAFVIGVEGAGIISVGLHLQAAILLLGVAISVPAFRRAVDGRTVATPREAFERIRGDWAAAIGVSVGLAAALLIAARPLTHLVLGGGATGATVPVMLILAAAPFDTLCIFSGVCYHAAHHDRRFLRATILTTAGSLLLVAAGGWIGATTGAALGYLASRIVSAAALNAPLLAPGRVASAGSAARAQAEGRREEVPANRDEVEAKA